ncbi:MAG: FAD-dependent oxidoreductase [Angelakisella sp.]|nr:FAD-dependent oxidoreductase [Angelakisella sp.]
MERFAIVGFGCAGYHGLRAIREAGSSARVDVYSDTGLPPYNPMLTTYYTAGRLPYEGLFPFGSLSEIAREYDAHLFTETRAARVDSKNRAVVTGSGERQEYDKILVAAGASAFVPGSFANLKGAFCMRTVEDAVRLHDAIQEREYQNAVIVGASMVGIKVAELLHKRGCQVTLADMAPHIFALAAYPEVSEMIEARLREMGIAMAFGQAIAGAEEHLDSNGKVRGYTVRLADGSTLETELLVLNIGTRAATGFLDPGEITIDRGILVDERMETSVPGIYAAGDCSQGRNLQSGERQIIGLWANAGTQGRVAGRNMAGVPDETDGNILHNITHFLDMDFIGLGDNRLGGEVHTYQSPDKGFYLQAVVKDKKAVGFNILDNYGVSGILKAHLIRLLRGQPCSFTPEQRGQLLRYRLEEGFIEKLEART